MLDNLRNLNDPATDQTIELYLDKRETLSIELSTPVQHSDQPIWRLIEQKDSLENLLLRIHKQKYPNHSMQSGDWKNIQQSLNKNEVAIEFSQFHFLDIEHMPDSIKYLAYIIKPDVDTPTLVYLAKEEKIKQLLSLPRVPSLYSSRGATVESENTQSFDNNLYDLIWEPLEKYLNPKDKVFFSTSGIINNIPIAALSDSSESPLCSKYNLIQYHTFPNKGSPNKKNKVKDAVLIGGLNFDFNPTDKKKREVYRQTTWPDLPGTKSEIDNIYKLLKDKISVKLVSDTSGSEEYVKSLDQTSPQILHIATHG